MGLSGIQRTVKFVKYLPEYGWNTLVITPRPRGKYAWDRSLCSETERAEVRRTGSLDPAFMLPPKDRPEAVYHGRLLSGLNHWLVPDNKIGWIPFAVKAALKAARESSIQAIYSTAPPYSSHLAAILIKIMTGLPLVSDFRDAWTGYTWSHYPTIIHRRLDHALEALVLGHSDRVIGVNEEILEELRNSHPETCHSKFSLIPHGYDPQDFAGQRQTDGRIFRISYSGTFIKNRSPELLISALEKIKRSNPGLLEKVRVSLAGTARDFDREMVKRSSLSQQIELLGYLPHRESVALLESSDLLWLVMGPEETANVTPGKLFEYLGARKPILASIPAGAASKIIDQTKAGIVVPAGDASVLATNLAGIIREWQAGRTLYRGDNKDLKKYDRREIAGLLARLLNSITGKTK
jgi:glycosyltransferase involved in cell wall biosynthesis